MFYGGPSKDTSVSFFKQFEEFPSLDSSFIKQGQKSSLTRYDNNNSPNITKTSKFTKGQQSKPYINRKINLYI